MNKSKRKPFGATVWGQLGIAFENKGARQLGLTSTEFKLLMNPPALTVGSVKISLVGIISGLNTPIA